MRRAALAAAMLLAPLAWAQPIEPLVEQLDAPEYEQRERASRELAQRRDVDLGDLERLLDRDDLSPEQRLRLERLAWQRFGSGARAGMGIQFGGSTPRGVQIGRTVAGFDAARVLRPRDVLLEIDGRGVNSQNELRLEILSRNPGEAMDLLIERDGSELEERVVMGSYADLNAGRSALQDELLRQAWALRRQREGTDRQTRTLDASLGAALQSRDIGDPGGRAVDLDAELGPWARWVLEGLPLAVVGGEARGGADRFGRPRVRIAGRDASLPVLDIREIWMLEFTPQTRLQVITNRIQERRGLVRQRLTELARERTRPGVGSARRLELDRQRERLQRLSELLDAERERWSRLWDEVPIDQ